MALLAVDVSRLSPRARQTLHRVCTDENAAAMVKAKIRQQQTAKAFFNQPAQHIEGIGETKLSIDSYWNTYFRMQYGDEIMQDPEFRKFIQREDDMFRVKTQSAKLQVGYTGICASASKKLFKKTYDSTGKR